MDVEAWREVGVVVVRRDLRLARSSVSMRRKGRYLLPADEEDDDASGMPLADGLGLVSLMRFEGEEALAEMGVSSAGREVFERGG